MALTLHAVSRGARIKTHGHRVALPGQGVLCQFLAHKQRSNEAYALVRQGPF